MLSFLSLRRWGFCKLATFSLLFSTSLSLYSLPKSSSKATQPIDVFSLLKRCSNFNHVSQIHALFLTLGLSRDPFRIGEILGFYVNFGPCHLNQARLFFDQVENKSTFLWNSMINSYSNGPSPVEALSLYIQMLREGAKANKFTFPSLLKACNLRSSALEGKQIHCQVLKLEREMDGFIQSTLIDMYANSGCFDYAAQVFEEISQLNVVCCTAMINGYIRFGSLDKAGQLFNEMAERDVISWSAMISGYVQMGRHKEAFSLFHEMQLENIKPNLAILLALLSMSSSLRSLRLGQWVHAYMIKSRVSWNVGLSTSGVDMYSKCGALEMALKLFRKIPRKDVGSWNAMISGLAMHGHGQEAIELFHEMQVAGFRPNDITFINILNACSHSGLVDMGQCLFESMIHNHGIDPKVQHYGCLVDLYGRAGLLSEAERVVKLMPMKPDAMALGSLINACRIHGNLELGERIGRLLIQDSPSTDGYYVILANLYASFERWDKVVEIRDLMGSRGSERNPGYSLIEVNGEARQITVCDERESCMIPN